MLLARGNAALPIVPDTIDIVVADMAKSLLFYRALGLASPAYDADEPQVEIATPGGATIGLLLESAMRRHDPHWITPVGQRVTFACRCGSPSEVDAAYRRVEAEGFPGLKEPWDAFWGQRYASLADPDGNRVDVFAPIAAGGAQ